MIIACSLRTFYRFYQGVNFKQMVDSAVSSLVFYGPLISIHNLSTYPTYLLDPETGPHELRTLFFLFFWLLLSLRFFFYFTTDRR